jgi:hypothetical protein
LDDAGNRIPAGNYRHVPCRDPPRSLNRKPKPGTGKQETNIVNQQSHARIQAHRHLAAVCRETQGDDQNSSRGHTIRPEKKKRRKKHQRSRRTPDPCPRRGRRTFHCCFHSLDHHPPDQPAREASPSQPAARLETVRRCLAAGLVSGPRSACVIRKSLLSALSRQLCERPERPAAALEKEKKHLKRQPLWFRPTRLRRPTCLGLRQPILSPARISLHAVIVVLSPPADPGQRDGVPTQALAAGWLRVG